MSLDISVPGGDRNVPGFSVQRSANGLSISAGALADSPAMFGMANDEGGLSISAFPLAKKIGGWAVYTFRQSGAFTIPPGAAIPADVLLVGGGGAGGGGAYGGGGGAGGFVDRHDVFIYSHEASAPHNERAYPDGEVIVGDGGAEVPITSVAGSSNQGKDSKLGHSLVAYGGGYGGRVSSGGCISYPASDGASGGGGRGTEIPVESAYEVLSYIGIPGRAIHNQTVPEGGDAKDYEQGHDGGEGSNTSAWYNHSGGGGGGAQWPAYDAPGTGGLHMTGGLGRICDIGGWHTCPDPFMAGLYKELGETYVSWFAGGGAGAERPNNWGFPNGGDGYRGGGAVESPGMANTGGGGGGFPWDGAPGIAWGPAGGSGIVIVRIPLSCKRYVTSPLQLCGADGKPLFQQVWDPWNETWVEEPVYPAGVSYTEVPADEPHLDIRGDAEPAYIWGYPSPSGSGGHAHRWGWVDGDFS